ncbi:MAG: hypothetical protein J5929_01905 [Eubacterium sp.]|nr:hypothetical protein [Eubacterium sp.]
MRTTKKERESNAKTFYEGFMNRTSRPSIIHVKRTGTDRYGRTQFWASYGSVPQSAQVCIAESNALGVEGCWIEFIQFIKGGIRQTTYYEDGFKDFIKETLGFEITYYDGEAFIIERGNKS